MRFDRVFTDIAKLADKTNRKHFCRDLHIFLSFRAISACFVTEMGTRELSEQNMTSPLPNSCKVNKCARSSAKVAIELISFVSTQKVRVVKVQGRGMTSNGFRIF